MIRPHIFLDADGIHHTDAKSSLLELRRVYPELFDQAAA